MSVGLVDADISVQVAGTGIVSTRSLGFATLLQGLIAEMTGMALPNSLSVFLMGAPTRKPTATARSMCCRTLCVNGRTVSSPSGLSVK